MHLNKQCMILSRMPLCDLKSPKVQDRFRNTEADVFAMLSFSCITTKALTSWSHKKKVHAFFWKGGWPLPQVSLPFPTSANFSQLVANYAQLVVENSPSCRTHDLSVYVNLCLNECKSKNGTHKKSKFFFRGVGRVLLLLSWAWPSKKPGAEPGPVDLLSWTWPLASLKLQPAL